MPEKIAATFKSIKKRLLKFIQSRVNLPEDAEDILQEVFYQFTRQIAGINDGANLIENASAWLYHAARNKIIDHYKKKKDIPLLGFYDEEEDEYMIEIMDVLFGEEAGPATDFLRSLIMEEIERAVADLPEEQRIVFELSELFDVPVKEIAKRTGVPINTVLSRKHYAVMFLRKRLKELYCDVVGAFNNKQIIGKGVLY